MNVNHKLEKYFFDYGLVVFPLLLLIGRLILGIFLITTIIYAFFLYVVYLFYVEKQNGDTFNKPWQPKETYKKISQRLFESFFV